ncbi:MAG: putative arsenical pump-driving ATPase [Promethearchaeota archaeon]|nr:MAG: putative arsenical pump-driving ATPase [Candidatus Lokiarchaeota archaeon]
MRDLKELLLNLKIIMFGGKGGVGKTTCASSAAIWAAKHGRNTLIISTDPAHSLGDSLKMELPPGIPTPVEDVKNLTALEINPKANMSEFKGITNVNPVQNMGLGGLMENFPLMEEIQEMSSMNPPGIDEALAFAKVLEFVETEHDYDLVIFDTAPTGHTLRFLSLPDTLSGWIGKLLKMRLKIGNFFGSIKSFFKREDKEEDNSLELLQKLNDSILKAREDLTDPEKNSFVVVMIPEEMAISETGRLINQLLKYNIPSSNIIVNQLLKESMDLCDFCQSRRKMQQKNLTKILDIFREKMEKNIIKIPLFKEEIRGISKLKEFGKELFS